MIDSLDINENCGKYPFYLSLCPFCFRTLPLLSRLDPEQLFRETLICTAVASFSLENFLHSSFAAALFEETPKNMLIWNTYLWISRRKYHKLWLSQENI